MTPSTISLLDEISLLRQSALREIRFTLYGKRRFHAVLAFNFVLCVCCEEMSLARRGLTVTNMKAAGVDTLAEEVLQRVLQRVKFDHSQGTAGLPRHL